MTTRTPAPSADPVDLLLVLALAAAEALAVLTLLLTLAGWRPSRWPSFAVWPVLLGAVVWPALPPLPSLVFYRSDAATSDDGP